jgi:hypothetical protein
MIKIETQKVAVIDNVKYPIVLAFDVLHKGWEMDDEGYIIKMGDEYRFVWSDHGTYSLMDNTQFRDTDLDSAQDIGILSNFISQYSSVINDMQSAIKLLSVGR